MTTPFEIKAFLDALGTLGTIVVGFAPASPDAVGIVREYGGGAPDGQFGVAGIKYEHPSIQVEFRGAPFDYAGPRAKAEIAWRALAAVQPGTFAPSASTYLRIRPVQSPLPLAMDDNQRHRIICNFWVEKELSA